MMDLTPTIGWYRKLFWCGRKTCLLCWFIDKAYWLQAVILGIVLIEMIRERL